MGRIERAGRRIQAAVRVLAISGSLRSQSTNTTLLKALIVLAPADMEIVLFAGIGDIAAFNPDIEGLSASAPVERFRKAIQDSQAVLFSTPEYAHGIPGSLKNALDWIVGSGELSRKPVTLVNASARGTYAQAALREVLRAMDARVLEELEVTVEARRRDMTPQHIAEDPQSASAITLFLRELAAILPER